MTPEEVVETISRKNLEILHTKHTGLQYEDEQMYLDLMNEAAMDAFKLGSNVAMSMVKGALLVQLEMNKSKGEGK